LFAQSETPVDHVKVERFWKIFAGPSQMLAEADQSSLEPLFRAANDIARTTALRFASAKASPPIFAASVRSAALKSGSTRPSRAKVK